MLKTRLLSAAIGIPILLGMSYLGGIYWQVLVVLLAGTALYEYIVMMRSKGFHPIVVPAYLIMLAFLLAAQQSTYQAGLIFIGFLLMVLSMVMRYPIFNYNDLALTFFGAFYTGYLFSFALILAATGSSFLILWMVFILTWASDVGGYLFGSLWGQNKLAPQLSPGKTWEGAAGGIVLTVVAAILGLNIPGLQIYSLFDAVILGLVVTIAAQLGDLMESSLKRYFAVKDSGSIIPGHGGVLDRFDSFMMVLPVVYYLLVVFA